MLHNRRTFLRQIGLGALTFTAVASLPRTAEAGYGVSLRLPRSTPEAQGVSSESINAFLDAVEKSKTEFHSVMIVRHGNVIAEGWWAPYAPGYKHTLYSLSKSFTSTAVGLAINEGKFSLDSKVISFFPDELPPEVSPNLANMKVQDLLTMSSGHAKDTIPPMRSSTNGESWTKIFLALPVEFEPGTHFLYNTGATYMLSAIVQKTTEQSVLDFLKPRLFTPLGIEGMDWEMDPKGIATGGYGLRVKTEDIAKFGQLYLQKGKWNGKQIVPASWIEDATSAHIDNSPANPTKPNSENDWAQGYGYQFWRCTHNAVRGDGAFGQFCIMVPELDMVVAITEESFDLQACMKLVWDYLLPSVIEKTSPGQSATMLQERLKGLKLEFPEGNNTSPTAATINKKTFTFPDNDLSVKSISFDFKTDHCLVNFKKQNSETQFKAGDKKWMEEKNFKTHQLVDFTGRPEVTSPLKAAYAWTDEKTLTISLKYVENAHSDTFICSFDKDSMTLRFLNSIAKKNPNAPDPRQPLTGKVTA